MDLSNFRFNDTSNMSHFQLFNSNINFSSICKKNVVTETWSYNRLDIYDRCIFIVDVIVVSFFCLFGFLGNGLSIVVLRRDHDKQNATNWLLQALAVLDTLYLVTCIFIQPLKTICRLTNWLPDLKDAFPYLEGYFWSAASITQTATIWMLVLVTSDRFAAVCRPLKTDLRSLRRARVAVGVVVIAAVLYNLPLFFEREVVLRRCGDVIYWDPVKTAMRIDYLYYLVYKTILFFVFRTVGPLTILMVLNLRLISALRVVRQRRKTLQKRRGTAKNRENITLMLVVVVSAFIVCEIPDLALRVTVTLMEQFSEDEKVIQLVNSLTNMLLTLNSSFNFVIYCLVGKKFRGILRQMFPCASLSKQHPSQAASETEPLTNVYRLNAVNLNTIVTTNV